MVPQSRLVTASLSATTKTAKALGLALSLTLLARADEVIA
jgi:hypothetical protein